MVIKNHFSVFIWVDATSKPKNLRGALKVTFQIADELVIGQSFTKRGNPYYSPIHAIINKSAKLSLDSLVDLICIAFTSKQCS